MIPLFVLHGGAGPLRSSSYDDEIQHMRQVTDHACKGLNAGRAALDVVVEAISAMEDAELYVAGRGSWPNSAGEYELDASLMEGHTQYAGAVGALQGFQHPIKVAHSLLEMKTIVMLVGHGAAQFAQAQKHDEIEDATTWFSKKAGAKEAGELRMESHGTVGCVARDLTGALAAGTSTGGVLGKRSGRVGDSGIIGAGTWADKHVAVSCTGIGEYFIREGAASQVSGRMRFGHETLAGATQAVLDEIVKAGGEGGMIAISNTGEIAMPSAAPRMLRAALLPNGKIIVECARTPRLL